MRLAILGAGGHGRDLKAIGDACGHIVTMLDDDMDVGLPGGYELVSHDAWVIGVNDPRSRAKVAERWDHPLASIVHPSASVDPSVRWGDGCVIGAHTQVGPETVLHDHVHIGPGVTVTRTIMGAFTTVSPGATVCGDVLTGERCYIGAGAVVSNLVMLADDVILGAGAVVPPGSCLRPGTWVGNPVRRT